LKKPQTSHRMRAEQPEIRRDAVTRRRRLLPVVDRPDDARQNSSPRRPGRPTASFWSRIRYTGVAGLCGT
jgi:hypothetical protein